MAQVENKNLPEEEKSSLEEIALINKMWGLVIIVPESAPRMKHPWPDWAEALEDGLTARMTTPKI